MENSSFLTEKQKRIQQLQHFGLKIAQSVEKGALGRIGQEDHRQFDESSKTFFQSVEVHERLTYRLHSSLIS